MSANETSNSDISASDISTISTEAVKDISDLDTEPVLQEKTGDGLGTAHAEDVDTNRDTPTPDIFLPQDTLGASVEKQDAPKSPEHEPNIYETVAPPEDTPDISKSDELLLVEIKGSQDEVERETPKKRKAEDEDSEHLEKLKKSRQSCIIVYEGKPQATMTPVLDLTVDATPPLPPPQEITLDESQEFSLRYDKDLSPIVAQEDEAKASAKSKILSSPTLHTDDRSELLQAEIRTLKAQLDHYKMETAELQSQIDKMKEKSESYEAELEATFPSSKEGVHTFMEKCLLYGTVVFTVDEKTNQVARAQVKQLTLLDECLPVSDDKRRTSLSSGVLADKSYQSNGSSVSVPGPFPLQLSRKSVMSAVSSSTSSSELSSVSTALKNRAMRSWDGPFVVPNPPTCRFGGVQCRVETLSCGLGCSKTFPHVDIPSSSPDIITPSSETASPSPETNAMSPKAGKETRAEQPNSETKLKNGTQQSNGETEDIMKNGESLEDEKQNIITETPQRQSAVKGKRKRQAKTSTPATAVKRMLAQKSTPQQKQTTSTPKEKETSTSVKPEGRPVFARWSDSKYYPGWVYSDAGSMLKVHFCDGNMKDITSFKVIPAQWVVAGTTALAANAEETYEPYLIVDIEEGDSEGPKYILEQDAKSCIIPFPRLALTEAQVQEIKQPPTDSSGAALTSQKLHMVSLDNVLDRPRTRTPTTVAAATPKRKKKDSSSVEPCTSSYESLPKQETQHTLTDTEYSTEASVLDDIRGFEVQPLDRECSPPTVAAHLKGKLSSGRQSKSRKASQEDAGIVQELGPIPEPGSTIFSGNSFLITYAENKSNHKLRSAFRATRKKHKTDSSTDDTTSASSDYENSSPAFNKERLRTQIRRGGGKVYNTVEQVPSDELDKTFLITDAPSCTPLYIQCIVKGIPVYNHDIIVCCCSENISFSKVRQNTPMLPSGWSLERQAWVERSKNVELLKNHIVLLAINQNEASIKFWKKILVDVGAKVQLYSDRISAKSLEMISIIVSDNECSSSLLEEVANLEIPVVSLVWVQQCIIHSDMRPYKKHPAYMYNYVSEPESPEY